MKRIILFVGLLAALLSLQAEAATAGRFQFVAGEVKVVAADGKERFARKGMEINEGEAVITSPTASAQIKMVDDGLIVVRPDTKIRITTFVFHGKADGSERSLISLVKGGFRAITGVIGRINKSNYKIETPTATIGIRGTDHEPTFIPNPLPGKVAIAEPGTYDKVNAGAAVLSTAKGMVVINPNQAGFVPNIPNALPALLAKIPAFYQTSPSQDEPKVVPQAGASLKSDGGSASTQTSTSDGSTNTTSTAGTTTSSVKTGATPQAVATDATLTGGTAATSTPTATTSKTAISNIQTGATVSSTSLTQPKTSVLGTAVIPLASSALIMNTTPTATSPASIPMVTKIAPVVAPTATMIAPAIAPTATVIAPVIAPTITKIAPVAISPAVSVIAPTVITIAPVVAPAATVIAPVVAPAITKIAPVAISPAVSVIAPPVTTIAPVVAPAATVIAPVAAPTMLKVAPTTSFSDRRLKKNIKRIGTHRLGIGIYEFDYIWGEHAIGVMADEVKQVMPEAVIRDTSGYDMVDYGKLN